MVHWTAVSRRSELAKALYDAARKPLTSLFLKLDGSDQAEFKILAEAAADLESARWARDYQDAVRNAVWRATQGLSDKDGPRPYSTMSWQEIISTLCGFANRGEAAQVDTKKTYDKRYEVVERRSKGLVEATAFKEKVIERAWPLLANVLASIKPRERSRTTIDSPALTAVVGAEARTAEPFSHLIFREEYVDQIRALFGDGHRIVCLSGEGGTGKSVLGMQAAFALEAGVVLPLRCGDRDVLWRDIVNALIAEGANPDSWSEAFCYAAFRQMLVTESSVGRVIVIDDVAHESEIWQLIPSGSAALVLVTSRNRFDSSEIRHLHIGDFSEEQAQFFIQSRIEETSDSDARFLAQTVGYRPLSLDHAMRFVRSSGRLSVKEMADALARDIAHGIDLMGLPSQGSNTIVSLYRAVEQAISEDQNTLYVLDSFLGLAGRHGYILRGSLHHFLASSYGGSLSLVRFESAITKLRDYGLLSDGYESGFSAGKPVFGREVATAASSIVVLDMHPLSCMILRAIRGSRPLQLHNAFFHYLLSEEFDRVPDSNDPLRMTWLWQQELAATKDISTNIKYLHCMDQSTWIAMVLGEDRSLCTVRFEVFEGGIYRLDYVTGEKRPVTVPEAKELKAAAIAYNERIRMQVYGLPPRAEQANQAVLESSASG